MPTSLPPTVLTSSLYCTVSATYGFMRLVRSYSSSACAPTAPSAANEPSGTPVPLIRVGASFVLTSTPTRLSLTCGYLALNDGTTVVKTFSRSSSVNQSVASPLAAVPLGTVLSDFPVLEPPPGAQALRP